jgi:hypothetical protein
MASSKKSRAGQRAITRGKIRKLQRAGLLSKDLDVNRKPSKYVLSQLYKYKSVISGKQAALKVSSAKKAADLRNKIGEGGRGRIVIVPREKGERFRVTKTDEIKSTRKAYGQTIEKTIGDKFTAPRPGEKVYYTIPRRKRGLGNLKRRTFASFDELLFYLSKYEIEFDDVEKYIEVERFAEGSRRQKQHQKEYTAAVRKLKRNRVKRHGVRKSRGH